MKRGNPEANLQRAVAHYLTLVLERSVVWSCIPSGGGGRIRGAQLKMMGLRRGLADIYIAWYTVAAGSQTIWLELKSREGKQSPEQFNFQVAVLGLGHSYYIVRSLDEVVNVLRHECIPIRARIPMRGRERVTA